MIMANQNPWLHPCLMVKSTILGTFLDTEGFTPPIMVIPQNFEGFTPSVIFLWRARSCTWTRFSRDLWCSRLRGYGNEIDGKNWDDLFVGVFFSTWLTEHIPNFVGRNSTIEQIKIQIIQIGIWNSSVTRYWYIKSTIYYWYIGVGNIEAGPPPTRKPYKENLDDFKAMQASSHQWVTSKCVNLETVENYGLSDYQSDYQKLFLGSI